ncbi:MAG: TraB/GumN family protein [Defluviitaleaceae bacterium]|nr:TraB/GumN family protein [Defluviitaleaceae bacterium]
MNNFFKKTAATLTLTATISATAFANIPIRNTFEEGGATVNWYAPQSRITILAEGDTLELFVNDTLAIVNGNEITLPNPIFIENGTSFLTNESLLAVLEALLIEASEENNEDIEVVYDGPRPTGFLHRIEHAGNTAYLFGTVHAGPSNMFPLHGMVYEAMLRSNVFATEIDMFPEITPELVEAMQNAISLPNNLTIADIFDEELYESFVYNVKSFGLEYEMFYRLSPTFLHFELLRTALAEAQDVDFGYAQNSVDVYVITHALERDIPVLGLVTNEQQLSHIAQAPIEVFIATAEIMGTLEEFVAELSEGGSLEIDFATPYINNDYNAINQLFLEDGTLNLDEALVRHNANVILNLRSREFAHSIIELLESFSGDEVLFVAVGASHVVRAGLVLDIELRNIVDFLIEEGVLVEPLWNN